jgi:hypothetical protein
MRSAWSYSRFTIWSICSSTVRSGLRQTTFQACAAGIAGSARRLPRTLRSSDSMPSRAVISAAETRTDFNAK